MVSEKRHLAATWEHDLRTLIVPPLHKQPSPTSHYLRNDADKNQDSPCELNSRKLCVNLEVQTLFHVKPCIQKTATITEMNNK